MSDFDIDTVQDWINSHKTLPIDQSRFQSLLNPFEDESVGSHLSRLTQLNCANPILTLHSIFESSRTLNTAFRTWDIDRSVVNDKFKHWLSSYTKNDPIILNFYKKNTYNYVQGGGKWKSFSNPLRTYRFCKFCLRNDEIPYFRHYWKLNFVWVCQIHEVPLDNSCLSCGSSPDFWKLDWDQAIDRCHNCKKKIHYGENGSCRILNIYLILKIQKELLEILNYQKNANRQFWKFVWGQQYNEKTKDFPEITDDLLEVPDRKILEIYDQITQEIVIETPYICQAHNKKYSLFNAYFTHLLMHEELECEIPGCESNSFRLHNMNLQCINCRSIYSRHGKLIERKEQTPKNCKNKYCKSKSISRRSNGNFLCSRCGAEFSILKIIRKGINPLVSCAICRRKNIKAYGDDMRCQICFTILSRDGNIVKEGIHPPESCISIDCTSRSFTRTKLYFTCRNCKSRYSLRYQLVRNGEELIEKQISSSENHFLCPNNDCNSSSYNQLTNGKSCKKCNSKRYDDGSKVIKQIPKLCPVDMCKSKKTYRYGSRYNQQFICRRCGSLISREGYLISKRNYLDVCKFCFSKQLEVTNSGEISCKSCNARINQEHQLFSEGIKHPENCLNSNCSGRNFYIYKGKSRCKTCGSLSQSGKLVNLTERGPKICSFCNRKNIQRKSLNIEIFTCRICGSKMDLTGKIIEQGVLPPSHCQYCGSVQLRRSKNSFRCKKCSKLQEGK